MELALNSTKRNASLAGSNPRVPQALPADPALHPVLQLQQQAGNQAVQELLRSGAVRAKLAISNPSDPEEEEADKVADHVMRADEGHAFGAPFPCMASGGEMRGEREQNQTAIHCREASQGTHAFIPGIMGEVLRCPGRPLDAAARGFFEGQFGRNFSDVRVHTGADAAKSAQSIRALAYASGKNVVFGAGQYAPETTAGRRLLAHELAHTVQQASEPESSLIQRQDQGAAGMTGSNATSEVAPPPGEGGMSAPSPADISARQLIDAALNSGDSNDVQKIRNFSLASDSEKFALIRIVLNQTWVGMFDEYALEDIWRSFGGNLLTAASTEDGFALWKSCIDRGADLEDLPAIQQLREKFKSDIKEVVTGYLSLNRDFVMAQMQQMNLRMAPGEQMAPPTLIQQEETRNLQTAAASLAKLQKAQEEAKQVVVGYDPNPTAPAMDSIQQQSGQPNMGIAVSRYQPSFFNPYTKPAYPNNPDIAAQITGTAGSGVTPYDDVKTKYDAASDEIARLLAQWPALYAVSREGKSEQTAAFAEQGTPAEARSQLAASMRLLLGDIEGTQTKLDAGDLDPLDLIPIQEQLAGGLPAPSHTQWSMNVPASVAKHMVEDHQFANVLKDLGLQTAAAALFMLAPFTGGASIFVALAGLAVTGAKFYLSAEQYEALAQAGKSSPLPGTEIVQPSQVERAMMIKQADEVALALAVLAVGAQAAGMALGAIRSAPAAETALVPAATEMETELATAPVAGRTFTRGPYTVTMAADGQSAVATHADYPNLVLTMDQNGISAFQSTEGGMRLVGQQPWVSGAGAAASAEASTALVPTGNVTSAVSRPGMPLLGPGPQASPAFGSGSPTALTLRQVLNLRGQPRWQAGEQYVQEMYNGHPQVHRPVPLDPQGAFPVTAPGGRFTDVTTTGGAGRQLGVEVKVYQSWRMVEGAPQAQTVPLSDNIAEQIAKDVALRTADPSFDPRWVFLDAPPSPDLAGRLRQAGIVSIVHGR